MRHPRRAPAAPRQRPRRVSNGIGSACEWTSPSLSVYGFGSDSARKVSETVRDLSLIRLPTIDRFIPGRHLLSERLVAPPASAAAVPLRAPRHDPGISRCVSGVKDGATMARGVPLPCPHGLDRSFP